jgi:16S rRNA (cytosine967-C5)-methyltransferase
VNAAAAVLADSARAISAVVDDGRSAEDALAPFVQTPQRAAVSAVTFGSLRWYLRLQPLLPVLLAVPPSAAVRSLLIAALHQLEYSRNPIEATVSTAVDAVRALGAPRAAGLVNAVLRRFLRERDSLLGALERDPAQRYAHPRWLIDALRRDWPRDWERIVAANNLRAPMSLRVDVSRISVADYLNALAQVGIGAEALAWPPHAIALASPVTVARLPGFDRGWVSVQDAGAQLAAGLLAPQAGERVLDACAAPGGKSGALLEAAADLDLVAVDIDAERVGLIDANLRRLRRQARLVRADLRSDTSWWDGRPFERILLDAPCSSTGVIRRHPDIKLLRRAGDVQALAQSQQLLLRRCWTLLAAGGRLLYCTCSVLRAENEAVIELFLANEASAREAPLPPGLGPPPELLRRSVGWQLLPGGEAGTDGFYYACLQRT